MTKPQPDIIAQFDQAAAGLANIARLMGEYYAELRKAGIPEELAFELVREYQRMLLAPKAPPAGDE